MRGSVRVSVALVVAMSVAMLASCADDAVVEPTSTTLRTSEDAPWGYVSDLLEEIAAERDLPAGYSGTLARTVPGAEGRYPGDVRTSAGDAGVEAAVAGFDDEQLTYLGYVYCLARANGAPVSPGVGLVADTIDEIDPAAAENDADLVGAIVIVNAAAKTLCTPYKDDTEAFIAGLDG